MSKDMLGIAVRKLVTLPESVLGIVCDLLVKMSDPDWVEATKKFLRKEDPGWPDLLRTLETTFEMPKVNSFVATEHFKVTSAKKRGTVEVIIDHLSRDFYWSFLADPGKVEHNVAETKLKCHILRHSSKDNMIIAELGGERVVETTLAHVYEMLKMQGQKRSLLTDGKANIFFFFVRASKSFLKTVRCCWDPSSEGWGIEALMTYGPGMWDAGNMIISPSQEDG